MPESQDNPPAGPGEVGAEKIVTTPEDVLNLPTAWVDAYWVQTWPNRVRISFGETFVGTVRYRSAITMGTADVERFVLFLTDMIEKQKKIPPK